LIPLIWVLTTFVEMANAAVVVDDLSVIDALQRGWDVFRNNLGEMVLMGLVLVLGGMIVSFLIAMPLILTIIPLMVGIIAAISGDSNALAAGSVIVSGLCCVAYLPVLIIIGGIVRAYIGSAWTLTYLRLTRGPAVDVLEALPPAEPDASEALPVEDETPEATKEGVLEDESDEPVDSESAGESEAGKDKLPEDF
jgi:hypothetical protein